MNGPADDDSDDVADVRELSVAPLTVLSTSLAPSDLRELVGLAPDGTWRIGDKPGAAKRFNGYVVRSRLSWERQARAHLDDLIERLDAVRVRRLVADARIESVRLWLVTYTTRENPAISLSPTEVDALAELGVGLDIDIYVGESWFDGEEGWFDRLFR